MGKKIRKRRSDDGIVAMIIAGAAAVMVIILIAAFMIAANSGKAEHNGETQTSGVSDTAGTDEAAEPPANQTDADSTQAEPPQTEQTTPETTEADAPPSDVPAKYDEALLKKVSLPEGTAPDGYRDKLVFFGDSTTYGMKAYKVFGSRDTKQVWTPTSGTLALFRALTDLIYNPNTGEEQLLKDLCASVKPEYLVMTLGVNGIAFLEEEDFKAEYQAVIDTILQNSPDTHLILQSIYPVASNSETLKSINNTRIQAANEWIVELAAENNLPYLNTYYALVGDDGWLPQKYQNGDGMHFNEVGFAAIMDYVLSHPYLP